MSDVCEIELSPAEAQPLLDQLRDLHLPLPVGMWPPAPGWWSIAALLCAVAIWLLWQHYHKRRRRAYRRQAAEMLLELETANDLDNNAFARSLMVILKRSALSAYPHSAHSIAGLYGDAWLTFLDATYPDSGFCSALGRALAQSVHRADANFDRSAALQLARRWVENHRSMSATQLSVVTDPPNSTQRSNFTPEGMPRVSV